ncbi:MAG: SDR family NAD(P)-dependent oxidoreductase [Methylococcales bacterium]|nr:SDR family NAD(P)-dependent oxidoreductase [Methylococcales bacterium]
MYIQTIGIQSSNLAIMKITRRILITGCSSGFGLLMTQRFAQADWHVLATTRYPELLKTPGDNIHVLAVDIAQPDGRASVIDYVKKQWCDELDCIINMEWPSATISNIALYDRHLEGFRSFFTRLSQHGKGKNPSHVIDVIARLADRPVMPLRIRVGGDSHALYYLRRLMPQHLADALLRRISNQLLGI